MRKENYWEPQGENDNRADEVRHINRDGLIALVVVGGMALLVILGSPHLYRWLAMGAL